jgi:hypothetical protein
MLHAHGKGSYQHVINSSHVQNVLKHYVSISSIHIEYVWLEIEGLLGRL